VIVVLSAVLGVALTLNPLKLLGVVVIVVLGSAFFSCLSMSIAGVALSRDRLMGIGQAITMPLFFSSNALYPEKLMPGWLQAISKVNPLSYEVSALRWLLIGIPTNLALDTGVLVVATVAGITVSSLLLPPPGALSRIPRLAVPAGGPVRPHGAADRGGLMGPADRGGLMGPADRGGPSPP
jgi:ABC-2 type transport system permease protein